MGGGLGGSLGFSRENKTIFLASIEARTLKSCKTSGLRVAAQLRERVWGELKGERSIKGGFYLRVTDAQGGVKKDVFVTTNEESRSSPLDALNVRQVQRGPDLHPGTTESAFQTLPPSHPKKVRASRAETTSLSDF